MGSARLRSVALALAVLCPWAASAGHAAGRSLFLSYASEPACVSGHVLTAALCRSAFANARAEFEARTTAFPDAVRCAETYGACAAWPPGAHSASFRPTWDGVDIVDTPTERSVTPSLGQGAKPIPFGPRPLVAVAPRDLTVRPVRQASHAGATGAPGSARNPERPAAPSAPPPPGSGFKLEDGVLTYPAPARFQPKNLPKPE